MIPTRRRFVEDLTTFATARMTSNACYRFVGPFIATIARGLHVELADIGVAIAISELFGLASPVIGRVVDRLGARRAVAVGMSAVVAGAFLAARVARRGDADGRARVDRPGQHDLLPRHRDMDRRRTSRTNVAGG